MRRNDKDASYSQRLRQDQKFCTGGDGVSCLSFVCLFENLVNHQECVRKGQSRVIPSDSQQLRCLNSSLQKPSCIFAALVILRRTGTNLADTGKPLNSLAWLEMNPTCKRTKSACRHTVWTGQRACLGDDVVKVPCCPPGSSPGSTLNKCAAALNARCNFNSFHLKHS